MPFAISKGVRSFPGMGGALQLLRGAVWCWEACCCALLHCTVLCCIALSSMSSIALCCVALCCIGQHCIVLRCAVLCCSVLHWAALHCAALRCAALVNIFFYQLLTFISFIIKWTFSFILGIIAIIYMNNVAKKMGY